MKERNSSYEATYLVDEVVNGFQSLVVLTAQGSPLEDRVALDPDVRESQLRDGGHTVT